MRTALCAAPGRDVVNYGRRPLRCGKLRAAANTRVASSRYLGLAHHAQFGERKTVSSLVYLGASPEHPRYQRMMSESFHKLELQESRTSIAGFPPKGWRPSSESAWRRGQTRM
jgi:hypothetical protein